MTQKKSSRFDHDIIYDIISEGSAVLDLGCGDGELLMKLIKNKNVRGLGIEKDIDQVTKSIIKGVPVLHMDLDEGLTGLPDRFFDFVILEKTLQAVKKPLFVLDEMLRVGGAGIVSFPNFGYRQVVDSLVSTGRMPVTSTLPYQWYDTPNIHLFTVDDFLDWAHKNQVTVEQGLFRVEEAIIPFTEAVASEASEVLFVVKRLSS